MYLQVSPQSTIPPHGTGSTSFWTTTAYISTDGTTITSVSISTTVVTTPIPTETTMVGLSSPSSTSATAHISPLSGNTGPGSHEISHSKHLIAATATAIAFFLLVIVAGVWVYIKRWRRRKQIEVGHQSSKLIIMYTTSPLTAFA